MITITLSFDLHTRKLKKKCFNMIGPPIAAYRLPKSLVGKIAEPNLINKITYARLILLSPEILGIISSDHEPSSSGTLSNSESLSPTSSHIHSIKDSNKGVENVNVIEHNIEHNFYNQEVEIKEILTRRNITVLFATEVDSENVNGDYKILYY